MPDLLRAEKHFDATGIANGIDFETTLSLIRTFKKPEFHAYKCTLETILTGAVWTAYRIHESNSEHDPICPRCNQSIEDSIHLLWQCPCNDTIESENIQNTQKFQEEARTKAYSEPCLWLRGILPEHYTKIEPEHQPTTELIVHSINREEVNYSSGTFYGDASGGKFTKYPGIRRIGCGICQIDPQGTQIWGQSFNLPGEIQTVPRGELYVLQYLVEQATHHSHIEYVTDSKVNADLFNKGFDRATTSSNCDLFKLIFRTFN